MTSLSLTVHPFSAQLSLSELRGSLSIQFSLSFNESSKLFFPQEWRSEVYPPYANGPGYVLSSDIAQFIVSEFDKHTLKVKSAHLNSLKTVTNDLTEEKNKICVRKIQISGN